MRKLWTIRWFRVLLGVVLTAALLSPAAAAANETAGKDSDWLYITLDPATAATARAATTPARSTKNMAIRRRILCSRSACT